MADRRRRRRQRASQDSEEESGTESSGSGGRARVGSGSGGGPSGPATPAVAPVVGRGAECVAGKEEEESECESEDCIAEDAVLSDYESAEEDSEEEDEERQFSEEERPKVVLKREGHAAQEPAPKDEGREEKTEQKESVTGERQSGDGQESTEPAENKVGKKSQKPLDDDEDRKNPAYIPRKGLFFEHDLRGQIQEEETRPKGRQRKLWKDEGRWEHDKFREDEQAPKSREELIAMYGYDIRSVNSAEDIRPRRLRKPRFGSPPRREQNWSSEKPNRPPPRYQVPSSELPPRAFNSRNSSGSGRSSQPSSFQKSGGYKENRPNYRTSEPSERLKSEHGYHRTWSSEQNVAREPSPEPDALPASQNSPAKKDEITLESQTATVVDTVQPPPPQDRPVEKKSYSRVRRSRIKGGDVAKPPEEAPPVETPPPVPQKQVQVVPPPPAVKSGGWEVPADHSIGTLEQEIAELSVSEQNWSPPAGQPQFIQPRELQGIPNHMHMGGVPPRFNRLEEMGVQGGRAKRYSSQRQRPVPEPPPVHISIMEGHYYDPLQFQGPIYTHGESPAPLPPQGMIVQPEMHLPHPVPGLHPHQTPAPMTNPSLYPPPVSLPPGQPPPQQLLPPPYFSPAGVMNFGNPSYPYAPGALPPPAPPHLYSNTQAQSQVYGGVTYYNTVHQQVQPKPSPPRRTSHPVTIKPPPPEENHKEKTST
ncbi:protein CASC3 [Rhinatrema bivittatum]|uniref:protein CASC3 n=1 Tax=Rhinatrema bivittatum TaxID=194408 RepID=UPI00112ECBE0|nr:protein CASC3 [Rhinatrema bivittatum]